MERPDGDPPFVELALGNAANGYYRHIVLHHALLSPSRSWAFLTLPGKAGIVTGTAEFMRAFRATWPHDIEKELRAFIEYVNYLNDEDGESNVWVTPLLKSVYGHRAEIYLPRISPSYEGDSAPLPPEGED